MKTKYRYDFIENNNAGVWSDPEAQSPKAVTLHGNGKTLGRSNKHKFKSLSAGGILALLTLALSSVTASAQWVQKSNGLNSTFDIVTSFLANGNNLFAGTVDRGVRRSTDNGANWTTVNTGLTDPYIRCLAGDATSLFVGTSGGVFLSTTNGTGWTALNNGLTNTSILSLVLVGNKLFAGTNGGGVFLSSNNGTGWSNWSASNNGLPNSYRTVYSFATNGSNIFAGTNGGVFLSSDMGINWSTVSTGLRNASITSLALSDNNLFAGFNSGVFRSTDNGNNWSIANGALTNVSVSSLAIVGNNLFAVINGDVYFSTNNGATWSNVGTGLIGGVYSMAVVSTNLFVSTNPPLVWSRPLSEFVASTTVASFEPTSGGVGATVTLTGTNFDTTPSNNIVKFNGVVAVVTASTSTSITTTVPVGASSGRIMVVAGGITAYSANFFGVEVKACSGIFRHPNAPNAYQNNQTFTQTFSPVASTSKVKLSFGAFRLENNYDFLRVYNGPTDASPLLASLSGSSLPADIISTALGGELTFVFSSDHFITQDGWYATVSCITTGTASPVANAATDITTTGFTANWTAVSGATGYRLDVSADNFATFVSGFNNKTVTTTNDPVTGLTASTAYKYRVRTVNANGTSVNSNVIDVTTATGGAPAAPVATAATSVSSTGITANWNAVSGATGYQLDISADNFSTFLTGYNSKNVTALSEVVTGLTASTPYKYRVRATNGSGTSGNSNVIDVTTGAVGTPPVAPVATAATSISATGFTANWNTVTGATGYQLDISADNFATFLTGYNSKSVTAITEVVTGLTASTAYKYRVRASNSSGTSANSNIITASTLGHCLAAHNYNICLTTDHAYINAVTIMSGSSTVLTNLASGCPLNSVSTLGYSDYTSISGQLKPGVGYSGSLTTNAGGCLYTSVFIDYNSNGLFTDAGELVFQGATALCGDGAIHSFTFTVPANAITGTTRMRVRSNGSGEGIITNPCIGYTFGESEDYTILIAPAAPVAVAATSIISSGFTANWNSVIGATGYQLDISTDNFATFVTGYNSKSVTVLTEVVTGLTATTAYKYRVRASNSLGSSANSNVIDVTTGAVAPVAPIATAATGISPTGFTANWNTVTGATGYQLDISADNFATFLTGYNSKSVTVLIEVVTGLTANTAYKYRVRASNGSGTSANSNVIDVTTLAKQNQTITFGALANKTMGDAPFALSATATSTLTVSYATTSDKITISSSQVTLAKAGRTTITASQGGDVTFNAAVSVDQSFCINPSKPTVTVTNNNTETPTFNSSALLGNQWFLNGTAISGATNQTLVGTQVGIYKVQVTVDDCVSEFSTDGSLIVTGDIKNVSSAIDLFPNPVSDWLTVSLGDLPGRKAVSIYQLDGKSLVSQEVSGNEARFNVVDYSQGIYIVRVQAENSVRMLRFVKQ